MCCILHVRACEGSAWRGRRPEAQVCTKDAVRWLTRTAQWLEGRREVCGSGHRGGDGPPHGRELLR